MPEPLRDDLMGAVSKCDAWNHHYMKEICNFVYNRIPSNAWGSYQDVQKYLESAE